MTRYTYFKEIKKYILPYNYVHVNTYAFIHFSFYTIQLQIRTLPLAKDFLEQVHVNKVSFSTGVMDPDPSVFCTDPDPYPDPSINKQMKRKKKLDVRHVTGNDQDYLRKIPRVVVQKSALL